MSLFSRTWTWAALSLAPLFWTWTALTSTNPRILHILVHPTGEWAARLLIVTLMITPLGLIFGGAGWVRWLRRQRRALGVATFGYALLHALFYLLDKGSAATVLSELSRLYIWTGWIAFAIFVPLAVTSSDAFVRRMGRSWKTLQRAVYAAAVLTLVHWAALHDWASPEAALVHFGPLIALEIYRIGDWLRRRRARALAA